MSRISPISPVSLVYFVILIVYLRPGFPKSLVLPCLPVNISKAFLPSSILATCYIQIFKIQLTSNLNSLVYYSKVLKIRTVTLSRLRYRPKKIQFFPQDVYTRNRTRDAWIIIQNCWKVESKVIWIELESNPLRRILRCGCNSNWTQIINKSW